MFTPTPIRRIARLGFACVSLAILTASPAYAADALIEGGRLCTEQFPVQEQANNIPTHLLAAISTTESGRWHEGLGMAVPWPWTINVEGKGYYFKTKAEAIAQTRTLIAQGHQSIDVGCMQVNLKHHSHAFANLEQAFDPKTNVAYAAKFLHDNYAELGDWIKATAAYHSRTQVYGQQYLVQIERSWNKIVAKVAAARANQSGKPVAVAERAPRAETTVADANASIAQAQRDMMKPARSSSSVTNSHPIAATHNVRDLQVGSGPSPKAKADEVLVIRGTPSTAPAATAQVVKAAPDIATPVVKLADADPTPAPAPIPGGDSVRRVALDNAVPAAQPKDATSSSKFVFAN